MPKIDFIKLHKDRLEQIKIDMNKAFFTKNWSRYNELKIEKQQNEEFLAKNKE